MPKTMDMDQRALVMVMEVVVMTMDFLPWTLIMGEDERGLNARWHLLFMNP